MKRPNKDAPLLELVREALREQRTQVWIQAVPPGAEEHEDNGAGETGHAAHDQAWPGAPCTRARNGTARTRANLPRRREPSGQGFPRRESEHVVSHGPHGVLDSRGQGLSVPGHRLP